MFRHHRDAVPGPNIVHPQVRTVRLLQSDEDLQAAIERSRAFERRTADDHQRRPGSYDLFVIEGRGRLAKVVPMAPGSISAPEFQIADDIA